MEHVPPRCPNLECCNHLAPKDRFFWRHGSYRAGCRDAPVPRFRCRACRRGFSSQTFRHDRGDRRPECNEEVFRLLTSGVGLRQCGRLLKLRVFAVQRKLRKIGSTCDQLHRNLCRLLPVDRVYLFDEEETYETASIRPLTMPVLIERTTWFVVAFAAAPIRRLAPLGTARRDWQDDDEKDRGMRRDRSKAAVYWVLRRLRHLAPNGPLLLQTDEKTTYPWLIRLNFGTRAEHHATSSKDPRTVRNALFPINTTMAMTRDNNGRLRRQSWLVTKRRKCLIEQMHLFTVYRNYVRKRFNTDEDGATAAKLLGLVPRAMHPREVVAWRQDWGPRSPHPLSRRGDKTVADSLQPRL
ncbi:MAG: hypothetical protein U1E73_13920 [Planctomycetota bacterium]